MRCCVTTPVACARDSESTSPVPLCAAHLAAASDWVAATSGVDDALPSPCAACGSRVGIRYPSAWICAACEWRYGDVVDGDLRPPRVDVVYYIRFDDRIKIGTTMNPRQRLARLWHTEVLAFERGGRALERRRHEQFASARIGGEWFAAESALESHVRVVAAGVDDPWQLHARWVSEALALR